MVGPVLDLLLTCVVLHDPQGARRGATVGSVDAHCLMWRAGLQAADLITQITLEQTNEAIAISSGTHALQVLMAASGGIGLSLRRRRWTEVDRAAQVLQAAWRGTEVRLQLDELHIAAAMLQDRWRRHTKW